MSNNTDIDYWYTWYYQIAFPYINSKNIVESITKNEQSEENVKEFTKNFIAKTKEKWYYVRANVLIFFHNFLPIQYTFIEPTRKRIDVAHLLA